MADTAATSSGADEFTFESTANKKYPLCPEGVQKVIVERAVFAMKDNFQKTAQVPTVTLWLSTVDAKYKPEGSDEQKPYRLFKTLKVSDHAKSNMLDFFQKVCGTPVPLKETENADGTKSKRIYIGPRTVEKDEDGNEIVMYKQFEKLEFSVIIAHEVPEGGTEKKDKIDTIVPCSADQKTFNEKLFMSV